MISFFKTIFPFIVSKLGNGFEPKTPTIKPALIYMKRVVFSIVLVLAVWGFIDPLSLTLRLQHAASILPVWFVEALVILFTGIWL